MAELLTNTKTPGKAVALAELASELKTGATTAVLKAALGSPYTKAGETFHLVIDEEIVLAEVVSGKPTELTLTRKQEKSTEANHTPGTAVWNYLTTGALERWRQGVANALTYEADPTGATASDAALTKALESSKIVYFPKGTYLFNENHVIKGQVEIYGDGPTMTTLKTTQANASILQLENAGCHIHDLKLEGSTASLVTEGQLLLIKEEVYEESGLSGSKEIAGVGSTRVHHIETVGGWIHINCFKATAVYISDWNGFKFRKSGLVCEGNRAESKQTNLIYVTNALLQGFFEPTTAGSVGVLANATEALTMSHVSTEFCEISMELSTETNFCSFSDCFFDANKGTSVIIAGGSKGCNFDKTWFQSFGIGGGLQVAPYGGTAEYCTFTNCLFFSITDNFIFNEETWKEISETEYNALASKKAAWVTNKVYAAKDGVTQVVESVASEQPFGVGFPITGGGIRYYEALKATIAKNPRGAWKTATSYAVKDTVESGGLFYEAIKLNESIKPPEATNWKEITEVVYKEGDFQPISPANGVTVGFTAKKISFIGCTFRLIKGNGIHLERATVGSEQNLTVMGCQFLEYSGFGIRIGSGQINPYTAFNQIESTGRGAIANDSATSGYSVFNTGNEFLTAKMSKPAEQRALVEGVQDNNVAAASNIRAQLVTYKTKADTETKVKHNLNSTAILSVKAYKYPSSKFESKMQEATHTVESFTVNTAGELTIKWSAPPLSAKEEIAIVIQAA